MFLAEAVQWQQLMSVLLFWDWHLKKIACEALCGQQLC